MNLDRVKRILKSSFETLAKHNIVYKKAILSSSSLNVYDTVTGYDEITFLNVALNSASDRTKLYNMEFDSKLYARFIVDSNFDVNKAYDKILLSGKEFRITDFSFLEQIPGLRKCELEIEIIEQ